MDNPLMQLNKAGISYEDMAKKTGLHVSTIYKIAKADNRNIKLTVKNAILIKKKLGIDLWRYFINN